MTQRYGTLYEGHPVQNNIFKSIHIESIPGSRGLAFNSINWEYAKPVPHIPLLPPLDEWKHKVKSSGVIERVIIGDTHIAVVFVSEKQMPIALPCTFEPDTGLPDELTRLKVEILM